MALILLLYQYNFLGICIYYKALGQNKQYLSANIFIFIQSSNTKFDSLKMRYITAFVNII